jgi:hypothetical protein
MHLTQGFDLFRGRFALGLDLARGASLWGTPIRVLGLVLA